jgi:hypothetical protein
MAQLYLSKIQVSAIRIFKKRGQDNTRVMMIAEKVILLGWTFCLRPIIWCQSSRAMFTNWLKKWETHLRADRIISWRRDLLFHIPTSGENLVPPLARNIPGHPLCSSGTTAQTVGCLSTESTDRLQWSCLSWQLPDLYSYPSYFAARG